MAKFNNSTARARNGVGPIQTSSVATATTFEGGPGYARDEKSELFLAAVSDFAGEGSFYESSASRNARINSLVHKVAVADPEWIKNFTLWLRNEANMRSISIVIALEAAKALNKAGVPGGRQIVSNAISRADEPGEALAYWMSNHGRRIPSSVKRGIADGATKTYSEYSLAKYDTDSHSFRFGDVIDLVHPAASDLKQADLFRYALNRRRDSKTEVLPSLSLLSNRAKFMGLSSEEKKDLVLNSTDASAVLKAAGLTWEAVAGSTGKIDAKMWEALIPTMGYMALLRSLKRMRESGVSSETMETVLKRLADEEAVARSRQLPFRFLSAYRMNSDNLKIASALEDALNYSLTNVPELDGNTLILVDRSGSMNWSVSKNTDLSYADTASIFGSALALRANSATLVQFGTGHEVVPFSKGDSVLTTLKKFKGMGGTETERAIRSTFNKSFTRVIILTDEQNLGRKDPYAAIPSSVPIYTWNLVGYRLGGAPSGTNRSFFGGLSDQSFKLIPLLERGVDTGWPWEVK